MPSGGALMDSTMISIINNYDYNFQDHSFGGTSDGAIAAVEELLLLQWI